MIEFYKRNIIEKKIFNNNKNHKKYIFMNIEAATAI